MARRKSRISGELLDELWWGGPAGGVPEAGVVCGTPEVAGGAGAAGRRWRFIFRARRKWVQGTTGTVTTGKRVLTGRVR